MNADGILTAVRGNNALIDQLGVGLSDVLPDERRVLLRVPAPVPKPADEFSGRGASTPYHSVALRRERKLTAEAEKAARALGRHTAMRSPEQRRTHREIVDDPASWVPNWYAIVNGWAGGYYDDRAALVLYLEALEGGEQMELAA